MGGGGAECVCAVLKLCFWGSRKAVYVCCFCMVVGVYVSISHVGVRVCVRVCACVYVRVRLSAEWSAQLFQVVCSKLGI